MIEKPVPAIVQRAELSEQQLIESIKTASSRAAWDIGRDACELKERFNLTDEVIAERTGLSREQIVQRRSVWDRFKGCNSNYTHLSWTHFNVALNWDDAAECLQWANQVEATVSEMKAWRRAQHGEDLTQPADDDPEQPEPEAEPVRQFRDTFNPAEFEDTPSPGITGDDETQKPRSPARAKQEPVEGAGGSSESAESRNSGDDSPPRSVSNDILEIRELARSAKKAYEPEQLNELADAFQSCANVLRPQSSSSQQNSTGANRRFQKPTIEEITAYCNERENGIDPEAFYDYYESNGWKVGGRGAMKDWKAAVRTWEKRHVNTSGYSSGRGSLAERNKAVFDSFRSQLGDSDATR